MKTVRTQVLDREENGDYVIAEIVEDVSLEERDGFEVYELNAEEDLTKDEKIKLSKLIRKYLKSYSKYKDKMDISEWLLMMFHEDFPNLSEQEIIKLRDEVLTTTNETYSTYEKVKKAGEIGIAPNEYFAMTVEKDENYNETEEREKLIEVDKKLTDKAVDQIYKLSEMETNDVVNNVSKTIGQETVNSYIRNIDSTIEAANLNMHDTILNKDGSISQNPNLDGFIAESHHANTFNIDAAVKELKLKAQDLKPDLYGKNSVDIVIKKVSNGNEQIVRKYQAKFGKEFEATASYFKDKAGEYAYSFQRKLVPKGQAEDISNAVDKIEYEGAESVAITKEDAKNMQEQVQAGDENALDLSYDDVSTHDVLARVGHKAVRNGLYAGAIAAGMNVGQKILSGEEVESDEVIAAAITTGANTGVTTAVHGALTVGAKKGVLKGVMANSNVISAIAFSCIEGMTAIVKMGNGELSFKEGIGKIGEAFTTGLIVAKGMAMSGGVIATLAGLMGGAAIATTVAGVVVATTIAVAGAVVAKPIVRGAMGLVEEVKNGAKKVVSAGARALKSVASCAWENAKSVGGAILSGLGSACSFVGGWFGW